ncbi:hypothetical protein ACO2XV_10060 [Escherichia coli]
MVAEIAVRYVNSEGFARGIGRENLRESAGTMPGSQTITRERNLPALPGQVV